MSAGTILQFGPPPSGVRIYVHALLIGFELGEDSWSVPYRTAVLMPSPVRKSCLTVQEGVMLPSSLSPGCPRHMYVLTPKVMYARRGCTLAAIMPVLLMSACIWGHTASNDPWQSL